VNFGYERRFGGAIALSKVVWVGPRERRHELPRIPIQKYINAVGSNFALEANHHGLSEFRLGKVGGRGSNPAAQINVTDVFPGHRDQLVTRHIV